MGFELTSFLEVFCHHARDQRVKRPLAGRYTVRVIRVDNKPLAAIMQHDAAFGSHDSRAKIVIERVDEAAGIPVTINDGDTDGATLSWQLAWWQWVEPPIGCNLAAQTVGIGLVQHVVYWNACLRWVGQHEAAVTIGKA